MYCGNYLLIASFRFNHLSLAEQCQAILIKYLLAKGRVKQNLRKCQLQSLQHVALRIVLFGVGKLQLAIFILWQQLLEWHIIVTMQKANLQKIRRGVNILGTFLYWKCSTVFQTIVSKNQNNQILMYFPGRRLRFYAKDNICKEQFLTFYLMEKESKISQLTDNLTILSQINQDGIQMHNTKNEPSIQKDDTCPSLAERLRFPWVHYNTW